MSCSSVIRRRREDGEEKGEENLAMDSFHGSLAISQKYIFM